MSALLLMAGAAPTHAADHRADASLQVSIRSLSEFDETEAGFGARVSYRLSRWLAADAEVGYYPGDLGPGDFSASRVGWLAGLRGGLNLAGASPFLALRAGQVRFSEAPEPIACIAIFPPPLVCILAGGETVPTVQATAGFQALRGDRLVFRVEAGDQLLRYSGPAFAPNRDIIEDHRWSHNFKATASVGLRF